MGVIGSDGDGSDCMISPRYCAASRAVGASIQMSVRSTSRGGSLGAAATAASMSGPMAPSMSIGLKAVGEKAQHGSPSK